MPAGMTTKPYLPPGSSAPPEEIATHPMDTPGTAANKTANLIW